MFTENAATKRQVDEVEGKVNVLQEQIKSVETQDAPINEAKSIDVQIAKINDQIEKSKNQPDKRNRSSQIRRTNEITALEATL
jgi:HlyD family secretion protein